VSRLCGLYYSWLANTTGWRCPKNMCVCVCVCILGCKGKGKTSCRQGWSRAIYPLILNLGSRWGWVVNSTLWPLHPRERDPIPVVQEAGWTPRAGLEPRTAQTVAVPAAMLRIVQNLNILCAMFIGMCVLQTDRQTDSWQRTDPLAVLGRRRKTARHG